jgi:hypothetical protein
LERPRIGHQEQQQSILGFHKIHETSSTRCSHTIAVRGLLGVEEPKAPGAGRGLAEVVFLHVTPRSVMADFREAFPDLNFWGAADLIGEGDYVVGRWEGGGTHTGPAFSDFLIGSLPAATGRKMRFTGTTVLKLEGGR